MGSPDVLSEDRKGGMWPVTALCIHHEEKKPKQRWGLLCPERHSHSRARPSGRAWPWPPAQLGQPTAPRAPERAGRWEGRPGGHGCFAPFAVAVRQQPRQHVWVCTFLRQDNAVLPAATAVPSLLAPALFLAREAPLGVAEREVGWEVISGTLALLGV